MLKILLFPVVILAVLLTPAIILTLSLSAAIGFVINSLYSGMREFFIYDYHAKGKAV